MFTLQYFAFPDNLKEVCPAEMETVAKQIELEKQREEQEKLRAEERKKQEVLKVKRKEKRNKVIEELIETERGYLSNLLYCREVFLSPSSEQVTIFFCCY